MKVEYEWLDVREEHQTKMLVFLPPFAYFVFFFRHGNKGTWFASKHVSNDDGDDNENKKTATVD